MYSFFGIEFEYIGFFMNDIMKFNNFQVKFELL